MAAKRPATEDPLGFVGKRVVLNFRRAGTGSLRFATEDDSALPRRKPHPLHGIYAGSNWFLKVETDGSLLGRLPGNGAFLGRATEGGAIQLTVAQCSWTNDEQGRRQRLEYTDRVTGRLERDGDGDLVLRLDIGGAYPLYRVNRRRGAGPEGPAPETPNEP